MTRREELSRHCSLIVGLSERIGLPDPRGEIFMAKMAVVISQRLELLCEVGAERFSPDEFDFEKWRLRFRANVEIFQQMLADTVNDLA